MTHQHLHCLFRPFFQPLLPTIRLQQYCRDYSIIYLCSVIYQYMMSIRTSTRTNAHLETPAFSFHYKTKRKCGFEMKFPVCTPTSKIWSLLVKKKILHRAVLKISVYFVFLVFIALRCLINVYKNMLKSSSIVYFGC